MEEIPEDEIFIIPVRLDDCEIPESFRHIHYVDLFEPDGFDMVLRVVGMEIGEVSSPLKVELPSKGSNQFIDPRDGQTYKTVKLVGKTWLAENLNFDVGEGCWFYDNDPENGKKYGRLYTWDAAKKACPPGWRLPTDEEWKALAMHFGGYHDWLENKDIGDPKKAYKALSKDGYSGFAALLGGVRYSSGRFSYVGISGAYWTSSPTGSSSAWSYNFDRDDGDLGRFDDNRDGGHSVRCLQI